MEKKKNKRKKNKNFILNRLGRGSFSSQRGRRIRYFAFLLKVNDKTFRGISAFYLTSGAVDYTAVIFCDHLVAVKCEVFTTTSTREIQLCALPATLLTRSTLLPANRQSTARARRFKWKGSKGPAILRIHPCTGLPIISGRETQNDDDEDDDDDDDDDDEIFVKHERF